MSDGVKLDDEGLVERLTKLNAQLSFSSKNYDGDAVAEAISRITTLTHDLAERTRERDEMRRAVADAARMFDAVVPMTLDTHVRNKETGEVRLALDVIADAVKLCADTMRAALKGTADGR